MPPEKPAMIAASTGEAVTFGQMNGRSNQLARRLHAQGLRRGYQVALLMETSLRFMEVVWPTFRSGLYLTAVNRYLPAEEAAYVINDCGAVAIITSYDRQGTASELSDQIPGCPIRLMVDGAIPGWASYEDAVADYPAQPLAQEWMGDSMLYSSGTTGRP